MQKRPGSGRKPGDISSSQYLEAIKRTGKQRAIPQRPPGMPHVNRPPTTPRVARPQRQPTQPVNPRRRFIIWGSVFVVCIIVAACLGFGLFNLINGLTSTSGAANTVSDFLSSVSTQNYDQAYNDLSAQITVLTQLDQFKQQAQNDDRCYGTVTNTSPDQDGTVQNNPQSYTYSYTITRSKLSKPYQMKITVQQDKYGDWKITSFGSNNDLGPGQPPCS